MNKVKFSIYFILIMFVSCFLTSITTLYAVNIDDISKVNLEEKAEEILGADNGNIDITKVITEYEKLTQEYTNDEIADMIEKNKDKLEEKGIPVLDFKDTIEQFGISDKYQELLEYIEKERQKVLNKNNK